MKPKPEPIKKWVRIAEIEIYADNPRRIIDPYETRSQKAYHNKTKRGWAVCVYDENEGWVPTERSVELLKLTGDTGYSEAQREVRKMVATGQYAHWSTYSPLTVGLRISPERDEK